MGNYTQGGPPGTCYSMSDSWWMESANFHEWFYKLFFPAVEEMLRTGPVVLFLDGHQSHSSLPLVEEARAKGIILFVFPPHTTHLLQPLDVGVFGPLKQVWSEVLKAFKLESKGAKVDKAAFPSLVSRMWDHVLQPHHLILPSNWCSPSVTRGYPTRKTKNVNAFPKWSCCLFASGHPVSVSATHRLFSDTSVHTHCAALWKSFYFRCNEI